MSDCPVEGAQENQRPIDDVHSGEKVLSNNVYKVKGKRHQDFQMRPQIETEFSRMYWKETNM